MPPTTTVEKPDKVLETRQAYDRSLARIKAAIEDARIKRLAWMQDKTPEKRAIYDAALQEHKDAITEIRGTRDAWKSARAESRPATIKGDIAA